jgi:spore maturation protein CgeB
MASMSVLAAPPRSRRILYCGDSRPGQTSAYRMASLRRLGQQVSCFDQSAYTQGSKVVALLRHRFPAGPLISGINRALLRAVKDERPDVVFFDKPVYITPASMDAIRNAGALTVCYNQDNPFGPRNDGCWSLFYRIFRKFDLHCLFRTIDIPRYQNWGLSFIKILLSFEPAMHYPAPPGWSDEDRVREVSYIGSPYEERPAFLRSLAEDQKIAVSIAGPRWDKRLALALLAQYVWHGHLNDADYREGIWRSKINLGFITRMNEEDIGHKSMEIAACRSFLLAERSEGHRAIFEEDREAVFFSSVEECADKARFYLPRPELRERIAAAGRERAVRSGYDNDSQLAKVLNRVDGRES